MVKGAVGWRHLEEVDNGEKVWVEEGEGGMVHHQTMNLGLLEEEEREGEGEEEEDSEA